ncbi:maleylacetate reductase [Bradyrhizobium sp. STM 3562]|uniref:maleylacetate reductase n=1 Tax=Bradyrhizobium sp. STM 3562 TaxID=578924 RepID=UPI003890C061
MDAFVYQSAPVRVVFGAGTIAQLPAELERLSISRALVLTTPPQERQGREMLDLLGARGAGLFPGAVMHTPVEVTEGAMKQVIALGADGLVAVGGGSTTGLAKALALRTDLPQVVVPTTYAGSEMTPILGETRDGLKTTQSSPGIRPETVVYDVDLTMTLPLALAATSGMNAIAHAVEALYARDKNPIISLMAEEGIRVLARGLPAMQRRGNDRDARADALYGAWLCGTCLGAVGMALHHKLCHTLGGTFDLPHAETHSIILPHVMAYNAPAVPDAAARVARALGAADAADGLYQLARSLGAKLGLKDIGMPREGIEKAAYIALTTPYWNPRQLDRSAIRELIARAWAGEPPQETPGA